MEQLEFEKFFDDRPPYKAGPIGVLEECIALQKKKGTDYQNSYSSVKQADYYNHGILTIYDIMHAKMLRIKSVMEAMQHDPDYEPNFESLGDSFIDTINYASFAVAYIRGEIDGQDENRDFLNRPLPQ